MAPPTIGHLLESPSEKDRQDFEDLLRRAASSLRASDQPVAAPPKKKTGWLTSTVTKLLRARAAEVNSLH